MGKRAIGNGRPVEQTGFKAGGAAVVQIDVCRHQPRNDVALVDHFHVVHVGAGVPPGLMAFRRVRPDNHFAVGEPARDRRHHGEEALQYLVAVGVQVWIVLGADLFRLHDGPRLRCAVLAFAQVGQEVVGSREIGVDQDVAAEPLAQSGRIVGEIAP